MTVCEKEFIQLLRAVFFNEEPPNDIDWAGVWSLARRHHLETIMWEAAKSNPTVPGDLKSEFNNTFNR